MSTNWNTIKRTLGYVEGEGIKNLDSPNGGLGDRYNVNLNHRVKWVLGKGPVCEEEMLPAKASEAIHKGNHNNDTNVKIKVV